jgi:hypothetical protein
MAKTYFEYADRQPESQINWFKVGSDITEKIKKEDDLREKRRAITEEQFRKDTQALATAPQGNSDIVNQWTLNYANDASEYLLQMNKLLKSGGIKPKDYNIVNQNLRDGTSTLFNLSKEYQAEYEEKMKRAQPGGDGSAAEAQIMGMIEGFANLKDTKAVINSLNGVISVGKMVRGKDGTEMLAEGVDNYMTVNQLRNRIKQKIDKYKLDVDLEGESKLLGNVVTEVVSKTGSSTETGFMTKITDQTKRVGLSQEGKQALDAYIKTENDIIKSKVTNPYNTSSILFDWSGGIDPKSNQPYQVVFDEKLANTSSHYILYSMKGGMLQPDFDTTANGREQKKTAEGYIRNKFRSMLEQKTEIQPFQQPRKEYAPQYVYDAAQGAKKEADTARNIAQNMVYSLTGNQNESDAGTKYLSSVTGNLFKKTKEGYIITDEKGNEQTFKFKADGKTVADPLKFGKSFIGTVSKATGINEDSVLKEFNKLLPKGAQINLTTIASGFDTKASATDPLAVYGSFVENVASAADIKDMKKSQAAQSLNKKLSGLGVTVKPSQNPFNDNIFVVNKDGEESSAFDVVSDPEGAVEGIKEWIKSNISGKTPRGKKQFAETLIKTGIIKGQEEQAPSNTPINTTMQPGTGR